MPLKWIKPKKYFTYLDISIYYTYRSNNIEDPYEYWYTTDINEEDEYEFDIRDFEITLNIKGRQSHKSILREAIKNKLLKLPKGIKYIN